MKTYYVYILASTTGTLYIGMTSDLMKRLHQHKTKQFTGFTAQYYVSKLLYVEDFGDVHDAIARERQLKGWTRRKKIALFEASNPTWRDLSAEWFDDAIR